MQSTAIIGRTEGRFRHRVRTFTVQVHVWNINSSGAQLLQFRGCTRPFWLRNVPACAIVWLTVLKLGWVMLGLLIFKSEAAFVCGINAPALAFNAVCTAVYTVVFINRQLRKSSPGSSRKIRMTLTERFFLRRHGFPWAGIRFSFHLSLYC